MAAGLCACAAKPVPPPSVDLQAMSCDSSMSLAGALPLAFDPKDEKVTGTVLDGKSSCVLEEGSARRLYQTFTLPDINAPYIITVRAIPWGDTIIAPKVMMLGSNGQPMRTTSHKDFTFRGQTLSALLRSHRDETYLVVTSDSEVLGNRISRIVETVNVNVASTGFATFYIYTGSDATNNMTLAPAGRIEVTLTPYPAK